jgi:hypothetical protein
MTSFDFESALALSIEKEELFGHLDSGEIGDGLFSGSPLTTPDLTPPPSPAQQPTLLESQDLPSVGPLSPPDHQQLPGDSSSTAAGPPGEDVLEKAGMKYRSNKIRCHAKRKRERANERKKREGGGQPYDVRASTRLKHVHQPIAVSTEVNLAGIPISAPRLHRSTRRKGAEG